MERKLLGIYPAILFLPFSLLDRISLRYQCLKNSDMNCWNHTPPLPPSFGSETHSLLYCTGILVRSVFGSKETIHKKMMYKKMMTGMLWYSLQYGTERNSKMRFSWARSDRTKSSTKVARNPACLSARVRSVISPPSMA